MRVAALYRYPVKGFTPESRKTLTVLADGRIGGDRVLGFRFADTPEQDDAWSSKRGMLVLMNTPGLARLTASFDDASGRLRLTCGDEVVADEDIENSGRSRLAESLAAFALDLEESPLRDHPERLPLRLIGDGKTPRYHDNEAGQITLHSRESLASVSEAVESANLDEARFRSNIAIEGATAWDELDWIGRRIQIGSVAFSVVKPKVRCLATHANPKTGERDVQMMSLLVKSFNQEQPTFAVSLESEGDGAEIHVNDTVTLLGA